MENKLLLWRIGSLACLAVSSVAVTASPQYYSITDLGAFTGATFSNGYDVNNSGQVAGYFNLNSQDHVFIWDSTTGLIDLGILGTSYGLNNLGQVTGNFLVAGQNHAFIWDSKTGITDLGTLGGAYSIGRDVNDLGQVTGYSTSSPSDPTYKAFIWEASSGLTDLGFSNIGYSSAWGINDLGQVTGIYTSNAFVWDATNGLTDLGTFGGMGSFSQDINNHGQVTGFLITKGQDRAFVWDATNGLTDLGTFGGIGSYGHAINNLGQVTGGYTVSIGCQHAFLWDSLGGMVDLNDFVLDLSDWDTLVTAYSISDTGYITGYGLKDDGQRSAFLLTPISEDPPITVPEPRILLLILTGFSILIATKRLGSKPISASPNEFDRFVCHHRKHVDPVM